MHWLGLAQPVGTIHSLVLIGTIPPCAQLAGQCVVRAVISLGSDANKLN